MMAPDVALTCSNGDLMPDEAQRLLRAVRGRLATSLGVGREFISARLSELHHARCRGVAECAATTLLAALGGVQRAAKLGGRVAPVGALLLGSADFSLRAVELARLQTSADKSVARCTLEYESLDGLLAKGALSGCARGKGEFKSLSSCGNK